MVAFFVERGRQWRREESGVRELFFMLLLLLVVLSLFVRAAFGWFTAGGELLLRAWAVECVCACTGMVEWSGWVRETERERRAFMDAAKVELS